MISLYKHEWKTSLKTLLIFAFVVGGMGFSCILLYATMENSIADIAKSFETMGSFSEAFGMNTISIATLKGFFASEIGPIHSLGGGMFAAILATTLLSKEEDGHTGEFLFSLPISRTSVITGKCLALFTQLVGFTVVCGFLYYVAIVILGDEFPISSLISLLALQLVCDIELAAICLLISACSKRNRLGSGLGVALLLYAYDLIGRVIPSVSDYLFIGPYSYCNAPAILSGGELCTKGLVVGVIITCICLAGSYVVYNKRDLAS